MATKQNEGYGLGKPRERAPHMSFEDRRVHLLGIAFGVAKKTGVAKLTRRAVAQKAKVAESLPNRYWDGTEAMREAVLREAVVQKCVPMLVGAAQAGYELSLLEMPRQLQRDVKKAMGV